MTNNVIMARLSAVLTKADATRSTTNFSTRLWSASEQDLAISTSGNQSSTMKEGVDCSVVLSVVEQTML